MSYTIRPSREVEVVKAPTIALAGETGSGKTESAMRLARGYVGPQGKFCVIDTEEKRALYKKARYQPWDWLDFQPPFTPESYAKALESAKGYQAVILDSGSHEWAGDGGCQDMQAHELERMAKGDAARAERLTALAWRTPKLEHKKFMTHIIRYPVLLIVCLRAEPKIKFLKDASGKTQIVDAGYQPIAEKMFGYEMLVFAMMHADNPGVPVHLKKLESDLEPVFVEGKQIDEATGQRLAQWASTAKPVQASLIPSGVEQYVSKDQILELESLMEMSGIDKTRMLRVSGIPSIDKLLAANFKRAVEWIGKASKGAKT